MELPEYISIVVTIDRREQTIRYRRVPTRPVRRIGEGKPSGKYRVEPLTKIPSTIRKRPKRRGLLGWFDRIEGIG